MTVRRMLVTGAAIVTMSGVPTSARAQQYPFSQRATLTQHVAHTTLTIEYGRPSARGRELFGALVPWDAVWHPGADSATTLRVSHAIELGGRPLAAGLYSLWLVPREGAPWTLIVSREAPTFHTPYPGEAYDMLRLDIESFERSDVSTMTIDFPHVLRDEATLRLQWGTRGIDVPLRAPYVP